MQRHRGEGKLLASRFDRAAVTNGVRGMDDDGLALPDAAGNFGCGAVVMGDVYLREAGFAAV